MAERTGRAARLQELIASVLPGERFGDHLAILSGTGQNVAGLGVYVLATLGSNILISRALGASALGVVTLATQFAFVGGAATRFGMDMAAVRRVAIDLGKGEPGRVRAVMDRAVAIAALVSLVVGVAIAVAASGLARSLSGTPAVFRAAALALPFVALCQVYLGGTRGFKIMSPTLYVYWIGQPVLWIVLMVVGWVVSRTAGMSMLAYAGSWILATAGAWFVWERQTAPFGRLAAEPGEVRALLTYGAPRAPAALLSQLLFWTDYFVFSHYAKPSQLGVYAAAVRVAQALVLFLSAVNYMFSPFVADLHARGKRAREEGDLEGAEAFRRRLDGLYKALTRWVVAGTVPILLLLVVVPGPVLRIFGGGFQAGTLPLRILLVGQAVNVATGSVGFILIMVGRTGWDLVVYLGSFLLDLAVAVLLVPRLHANGAAIAQAATLVTANGVRLWLVWRFVRIQPFNRHYFRLAIPAAISGAVMVAAHAALRRAAWPIDLLGTAAAGLAAYLVALATTGLTPTERGTLRLFAGMVRRRPA